MGATYAKTAAPTTAFDPVTPLLVAQHGGKCGTDGFAVPGADTYVLQAARRYCLGSRQHSREISSHLLPDRHRRVCGVLRMF